MAETGTHVWLIMSGPGMLLLYESTGIFWHWGVILEIEGVPGLVDVDFVALHAAVVLQHHTKHISRSAASPLKLNCSNHALLSPDVESAGPSPDMYNVRWGSGRQQIVTAAHVVTRDALGNGCFDGVLEVGEVAVRVLEDQGRRVERRRRVAIHLHRQTPAPLQHGTCFT